MRCPACEAEVEQHQKFCNFCGVQLHTHTRPDDADEIDTIDVDDTGEIDVVATDTDTSDTDTSDTDATRTPPSEIDITTSEIDTTTSEIEAVESGELPPPTVDVESVELPPPVAITEQMPMVAEPPTVTAEYPVVQMPVAPTDMIHATPAVFDGSADISHFPEPREPFRLRMIFLLSIFAAAAMLMTIVADVIDIRTTRPVAGIVTGTRMLDDFGSNLAFAGFVGAAVLVIGSLLACFGLRWGAGLAGGAGLALVGWAGLSLGLAELPIAVAESITRTSTAPEPFTLRITRDIGWWLIAGLGAIGLIVFLASMRWIGAGRRVALNPMVAALTAVAIVVLAFGPLVPVGTAEFADNFRSTDPLNDLPWAFYAGRLAQVGLVLLAGVVGMLIVRSYGLGLAVGAVSVSVWLWASSFSEVGPRPIGIADRNPGATSTIPHAVTTGGMVATLALLLVASVLATWRLTRTRTRRA
jgi:hypothetical protein